VATYAIGDVQGCFATLQELLREISFDPQADRLWFVGDLVNRGPRSLEVLRWLRAHDHCITAVLGNHDLHLLARAVGLRKKKSSDTLDEVLAAPDRDELIDWVRHRPLLHREHGFVLVHAGLLPAWTVDEAAGLASEIETGLRSDRYADELGVVYGKRARPWDPGPASVARVRSIVAAFTRLRCCDASGEPRYDYAGPPSSAPAGYLPWFEVPSRRSTDHVIVCGHWAALGLHLAPGVIATDTACVWGESLTAVRLPDRAVFQVSNCD
jgi:bis(5'-nucleosyl)-tetraphosphatase (symmetrical)